ncbi:hypothetical protein Btru_038897 [Bulinus truncatus]|nr:hypothetical protein Btru_038897 [Bulinus truncatus]
MVGSLIRYLVMFCAALLHAPMTVRSNCSRMKIFNVSDEIFLSGLCKVEFDNAECQSYFQRKSDLPDMIRRNFPFDTHVSLDGLVRQFEENGKPFHNPGVKLQWNPPSSENSRDNLQGYLLTFNNATDIYCRLFGLNLSILALFNQTTFMYDLDLPAAASGYNIVLYRIVKSTSRNDQGQNVTFIREPFLTYHKTVDPGLWHSTLTPRTYSSGVIEAKFTLSPVEFGLTQFVIKLFKISTGEEIEIKNETKISKVNANDPFGELPGKCLCRYNSGVCRKCKRSETKWIYLNVSEEQPTYPATTTTTTLSPVPTTTLHDTVTIIHASQDATVYPTNISDVQSNQTVIPIVSACALLAAASVSVFLLNKKKCRVFLNERCSQSTPSAPHTHPLLNSLPTVMADAQKSPAVQPSITIKKLYIMSADDHIHHKKVVICFAKFLELHCYCKVIYPPTAADIHSHLSPYAWFIRNIKDSDCIVFVCSARAQKLVAAIVGQDQSISPEFKPNEDIFTEGLKYYLKNKEARDKTIKIFFGADQKDLCEYITTPFTYAIPNNLPDFVIKVQSISEKDTEVYSSYLPLLQDTIPSLQYGEELLESIQISSQYDNNNPDWIKKYWNQKNLSDSAIYLEDLESEALHQTSFYTGNFCGEHTNDNVITSCEINSFYTVPISDNDFVSVCAENVPCTANSTQINSESQESSNLLLVQSKEDHGRSYKDSVDNAMAVCREQMGLHLTYAFAENIVAPEDMASCCTGMSSINEQLTGINKMNENQQTF